MYTSAYSVLIDAYTQVVIDHVKARPSVQTWLFQHAFIDIDLTLSTNIALYTGTVEAIEEVLKEKSIFTTGLASNTPEKNTGLLYILWSHLLIK